MIFGLDVTYVSANYSGQTIMQEILVDDSINGFQALVSTARAAQSHEGSLESF